MTNIETEEYENFSFSVIEKAIELRRPNLIGDDSVFVFDLADDTDVVAIDGVTVIIALSASVAVRANTAPSPASALLVQLKQMISKYFESYRVKAALADYTQLHRRLKEQLKGLKTAENHKQEAAEAMKQLVRTVQVQISAPAASQQRVTPPATGPPTHGIPFAVPHSCRHRVDSTRRRARSGCHPDACDRQPDVRRRRFRCRPAWARLGRAECD